MDGGLIASEWCILNGVSPSQGWHPPQRFAPDPRLPSVYNRCSPVTVLIPSNSSPAPPCNARLTLCDPCSVSPAASNKYQLKHNQVTGEVSLLISRIGPGDEGEYTCMATNQYGEAVCTVYIQPEGECPGEGGDFCRVDCFWENLNSCVCCFCLRFVFSFSVTD